MNYFDYELLERYLNLFGFDLDQNPSKIEIKSAYRKLIAKNHPDKVSKLDKEIQDVAKKRTQELNEAFDYIEKNYEPQKVYEKTEKIKFEDTDNYQNKENIENDTKGKTLLYDFWNSFNLRGILLRLLFAFIIYIFYLFFIK